MKLNLTPGEITYVSAFQKELHRLINPPVILKEVCMCQSNGVKPGAFVLAGNHIINQYEVARIEKGKHDVVVYMKNGDAITLDSCDGAILWTAFRGL